MKDLYLIDGYNVIFWLPEEFPRTDLESSRKKLVDLMQDYGAHNDVEVIVVFDGNSRSLKAKVETVSPFFHVVYTPSKMTADSYIEMESYKRRDSCCLPMIREHISVYIGWKLHPENLLSARTEGFEE